MTGFAATTIAVIHGIWVLTVVLGPLMALRWRKFRIVHSAMMLITIILILSGNLCPLTTLENRLRPESDAAYEGSFIATYLNRLFGLQMDPAWIFYGLVTWFLIWTPTYAFLHRKNPR